MQTKVKATYENGVFVPMLNGKVIDLPERAEVEITVETIESDETKSLTDESREIAESMKRNAFNGNPPRFSREELYERR